MKTDAFSRDGTIALFLDIDGTLLDVAASPEAVIVPPGLAAALALLERSLDGALALVTGRRIAAADRLFAPLRLVTAGVHGAEIRAKPGGETRALAADLPKNLIDGLRDLTRAAPGVVVETKGAGVAVHYRAAPEVGPMLEAALGTMLAATPGALKLTAGRKIFEIGPPQLSKGSAVETLANLAPFRGRFPVFIGDDKGDEPAFAAVERLGGVAFKVAGEHFQGGGTHFGGPAEVRTWLAGLAHALGPATLRAG